ncbi:hypothetical protein Bcav_1865 [Beutenbergia cavernae DSM 12333]|uniref:Rhamnogalacturonase A/B/Epimerase-like pectate lyase domain-containing protein n=1 Tax=Beutenbergia cavernae (strain ATCC BAA-8 / DSM 12333 / CCUG 43141 / JCM 11478 / NBRC 16432 / NCIMB 13614 / HKI 0122) TaxID=471853 RepID=C5C4Z3_BEUC1|nr:glycosyl hydrolase family 28-related protein [Beutenbergia cavernae]ACQ80121.1 hypothetical protein Bcav_1865 [Beutenbergia cavernae DSM 12333]
MSQHDLHLDRRTVLTAAGVATAALVTTTALPGAAAPAAPARPSASVTDFGADPTGVEHAAAAFQACLDSLAASGGTVLVPPGTYLLAGEQVVELRSNVDIVGENATIVRRERTGSYVVFVGLSHGRQGRRSGVTNVTMRGLTFRGVFRDAGESASICAMALHHCADIRVEDCEFVECQGGAGHTFDLCGCDDISFTGCTWRGYHVVPDIAPTAETIQLDISHSTTVSYPDDAGSYDALATRSVTIERCRFLPLELDGEVWPAPNPVGAHFEQEGQPYSGLVLRDVEIVDPASDPRPAENGDNVRPPRGIIHVPQIQDALLENVTVRSTTGQTTNRVLMFTSNSWGRLISDANIPGSRGYYAEPVLCSNIDIRNLVVEGFASDPAEDPAQNPVIWISGVDGGPAEDISISATIRDGGATAVAITKARRVHASLEVAAYARGLDITGATDVRLTGSSFDDVDQPVVLTGVDDFGVHGSRGTHTTRQDAALTLDAATDHGVIAGTRWSGYDVLRTGGGADIAEHGNSVTPGPA